MNITRIVSETLSTIWLSINHRKYLEASSAILFWKESKCCTVFYHDLFVRNFILGVNITLFFKNTSMVLTWKQKLELEIYALKLSKVPDSVQKWYSNLTWYLNFCIILQIELWIRTYCMSTIWYGTELKITTQNS